MADRAKSRLVLGTAQLGMAYGINNTHGQPTKNEAFVILDAALAGGINTFDTAYAYGDAEDILGEWIKIRSLEGKISVISKLKPHVLNEYPDGTKADDAVREEIQKSLERLNLTQLDGYLLHSPYYIYSTHIVAALRQAKEEGLVKNIGVSIYDETEAIQAAELAVDYIQVPYNLFDQRLDKTHFFNIAKKNGVQVFARSPFLQGLLVMEPDRIPPHLAHARPSLEKFDELSRLHNVSRTALSLLFSWAHSGADHIVFGVETLDQLKEDLAIIAHPPAHVSAVLNELKEYFKNIPESIISPSLWSKLR